MRRLVLPVVVLAAGLVMIGQCTKPAHAQAQCEANAVVEQKLAERGAKRVAAGLSHDGTLTALYLREDGAWVLTTVTADGLNCYIDHGISWQSTPAKPAGAKS